MQDIIFKSNDKYYPLATSRCGQVKNLETGNILKQPLGTHGYPTVSGRIAGYSYRKCMCSHRLVAEIWLPNPNNHPVVNHIDADKTNNHVDNIEWTTFAGNSQHAADNGLLVFNGVCGEKSNIAIYSDEEIHAICKDLSQGMRNCDVARKYGISDMYIKKLKRKGQRRDITSQYTFHFKKPKFTDEVMHWVCERLQDGKTQTQILAEAEGVNNVNLALIKNLRGKKMYKHISSNYNW